MIVVLSNPDEHCLTFYEKDTAYYIGYRFLEGIPIIIDKCLNHSVYSSDWGDYPSGLIDQQEMKPASQCKSNWLSVYDTPMKNEEISFSFRTLINGSSHCTVKESGRIQEFYFQPMEDGLQIWFRFTALKSISTSYCVQQCLRFTGRINAEWRQSVAYIPFLSELDMQAMGNPNGTMTFARKNNNWLNFPVPYTMYQVRNVSQDLHAQSSDYVDSGLIVRQSPDRQLAPGSYFEKVAPHASWQQVSAGMYWERTVFISNRHPADCVHAWIDIGPLEAGQSRTLHGKVYFIEDSKETLYKHWQKDFSSSS